MQLVQDGLRQRNLAPERRVHCVVEQVFVQQSVSTDRVEVRLTVDQNASVPIGHFAIDSLERRQAAHRIAVEIPGLAVVVIGLIP